MNGNLWSSKEKYNTRKSHSGSSLTRGWGVVTGIVGGRTVVEARVNVGGSDGCVFGGGGGIVGMSGG